jgi:aminoglycoside 2''-phosphotransferase
VRDDELLSTYVGLVARAWDGSFGREPVRLHRGRDHDVVLVGREAAFRFPRHRRAHYALPREVAALNALAQHGGVSDVVLPQVFLDCSDAPLGSAFVGQRFLDGEPLPRTSVDALGPMAYRFAVEIARLLDAIANVPLQPPLTDVLHEAPLRATFPDLAEAIRALVFDRLDPGVRSRAYRDLDAAASLDAPHARLVHGDVTGTNLLWDADATRLTGVLDWAQVHVGDPAYDLASLADTYGWDLVATVAATLENGDAGLLDRARVYAATFPLQRAYGAITAGDEAAAAAAIGGYA